MGLPRWNANKSMAVCKCRRRVNIAGRPSHRRNPRNFHDTPVINVNNCREPRSKQSRNETNKFGIKVTSSFSFNSRVSLSSNFHWHFNWSLGSRNEYVENFEKQKHNRCCHIIFSLLLPVNLINLWKYPLRFLYFAFNN